MPRARWEEMAEEANDTISKNILSKTSGLSRADCIKALEEIHEFCGGWVETLEEEERKDG